MKSIPTCKFTPRPALHTLLAARPPLEHLEAVVSSGTAAGPAGQSAGTRLLLGAQPGRPAEGLSPNVHPELDRNNEKNVFATG